MSDLSLIIVTGVAAIIATAALGANDASNSVADAVSSKTLTVRQAMIACAIFEVAGTLSMGSSVASTISKGIVTPELFLRDSTVYMVGMLSALLGAGSWLVAATFMKLPVSTTHSIVGALFCIGLIEGKGTFEFINVKKIIQVVVSWVISPVMGGLVSGLIYGVLYLMVLRPRPKPVCENGPLMDRPEQRAYMSVPAVIGIVIGVIVFFIVHESAIGETLHIGYQMIILFGIAILFSGIGYSFYPKWYKNRYYSTGSEGRRAEKACITGLVEEAAAGARPGSSSMAGTTSHAHSTASMAGDVPTETMPVLEDAVVVNDETNSGSEAGGERPEFTAQPALVQEEEEAISATSKSWIDRFYASWEGANRAYILPQVIASLLCAFAHGSNDSGNTAGLFSGAYLAFRGELVSSSKPAFWIMAVAALCIAIGIIGLGHLVATTIGKISTLTPVAATATSLGTVLTVLIASALSLPVSSSHILTGCVLGVGIIINGWRNVDWKLMGRVGLSWIATIPFSMGATAVVYYATMAAIGKI